MPQPKYRTSKSKRNTRRAHDALAMPSMAYCPNCGEAKHPHIVCGACGHYRGQQVMEPKRMGSLGAEDFEVQG